MKNRNKIADSLFIKNFRFFRVVSNISIIIIKKKQLEKANR